MKFGKEFASQMVQEWQEAYMDYNYLKTILKNILHSRHRNDSSTPMAVTPKGSLTRRISLYRAFSGLTSGYKISSQQNEDEVILVSAVQQEEAGSEGNYQTMFLMSAEEGAEFELVFFRRLDDEFNKVVKFYKAKVAEVLKEAEELEKQMDALIALRIKVENPVVGFGGASMMNENSSPSYGRNLGRTHMEVIQEVEMTSEEVHSENENRGGNVAKSTSNQRKPSAVGFKPASLEILNHVNINIIPETPVSTLKGILMSSKSDRVFSKKELRKAEKLMTKAFIEFYHKLLLLKSYCFLNQLAFSKIMKKYDKISSRNASKAYLKMVDDSYLGSSDEVIRLIERVESAFVKHFSNGNRRKGMNTLKPQTKREKHRTTYFLGLFSGCSIALAVAIVVLIHARDILNSKGGAQYMENIFPLYSLFGFIVLHMLMYSANIYFWRHYRVNYSFIFGFKQGTELGYRQVFLLSSALAVISLAGVLVNLDMEMDPRTQNFGKYTELVPLAILLVLVLIILCPFNIIFRSSRFFLITCLLHCVGAPLYKVTLPDFFLADQFTSQVQALRSLEFYICYYGWGDFKKRSNKCKESNVFDTMYFIVAVIPYWSRFLQCLRRLFEEKDVMHGFNGLKYFSTIVALVMRTAYDLNQKNTTWKIMAAASSGLATIFNTYWDIVIDWGLLRRNSRNPWLRDKLVISNKSVYFTAMVGE